MAGWLAGRVVNGIEDIKLTAPWSRKTQPLSGRPVHMLGVMIVTG